MIDLDIAAELRAAGLLVIPARPGIGSIADTITVEVTGTPKADDGASDVNQVAIPRRAVAYIDRVPRVWLLADGPVNGTEALVLVAAFRDDAVSDEQQDTVDVVTAVLRAAYETDASSSQANPSEPTGDDQGDNPDNTEDTDG